MNNPSEHVARRRPVWEALSQFFLDTELDDNDLRLIAQALAESKYTDNELAEILYQEIYPVCVPNLHSPAGEWQGFDLEWLEQQILKNAADKPKEWPVAQPSQWMIEGHWRKVLQLLPEQRRRTMA